VVSGEFVEKSKPEPDIFLLVAEKLNVKPEECIVLEDSFNGMLAAKGAKMKCFVVPDGENDYKRFEKADRIFALLLEVKEYLLTNSKK